MNEQQLTTRVSNRLKALRLAGEPLWYVKIHGGPYQRAGVPDFLICYCGVFLALELKNPDDPRDPSPAQRHELRLLDRAQAITGVCLSWEDVERFLRMAAERAGHPYP